MGVYNMVEGVVFADAVTLIYLIVTEIVVGALG